MVRDSTFEIPCAVSGQAAVPTCLFGYCNGSVVPECVCWDGFRHDRMVGRYNNCALPEWVPWAGGAISFTLTIIGFLYGLYVAVLRSVPRSLAWRIAVSASFASLMFFGATTSLHLSPNLQMPVFGAVFNNFGTAAIAHSIGIMVVVALAPVDRFKTARYGLKFFRRFMLWVLPGFLFFGTMSCTITGYALDDEQKITDAMGGVYSILAFAAICACPIMFFHLRNFIKVLDDAIKLQGDLHGTNEDLGSGSPRPLSDRKSPLIGSPKGSKRSSLPKTSNEIIVNLRRKVMGIMITATISSFLVFVVCIMCALFQFLARTVPLSWLVYYAITCCIGLFACQLAYAAQRTGPSQSMSSGGGGSRGDMSPPAPDARGSIMASQTAYQGSTGF